MDFLYLGHAVAAEIVDVLVHDRAVDLVAVIEIVDVLIVGVVVVLVLIVKALVESLVLAASLKKGRKTVVPNQDKVSSLEINTFEVVCCFPNNKYISIFYMYVLMQRMTQP